MPDERATLHHFTLRVLVVLALVALALLLWTLADLILLVFGAGLVAIVLSAIAEGLARRLHCRPATALAIAVVLLVALLAGAVWLVGHEVGSQFKEIFARVPQAWEGFRGWLQRQEWGGWVLQGLEDSKTTLGALASHLPQAVALLSNGLLHLVLVLFGGVYLASNPAVYRDGFLKLFPPDARERMSGVADVGLRALRLWLRAQLITMAIVGALTTLGLWLVGVPAPLALGLIAGLAEFVPYVGPIAAAVPGVLLALTVSPELALYAALVYLAVQQLEGNLILPLVERDVLKLPPALVIFSVVACGLVFGTLGWIFAAPLTVLLVVVVGRLYVRETLGAPASVPGEQGSEPAARSSRAAKRRET